MAKPLVPIRRTERLLVNADRLTAWARAQSYLAGQRVPPGPAPPRRAKR
jgi:hypothetical protein